MRQFFGAYRVAEFTYIRKTFEEFKGIIWDFVEQMSEDCQADVADDNEVAKSLGALREAVEADSIGLLRSKSKEFIDFYHEHQNKREGRRNTYRIRSHLPLRHPVERKNKVAALLALVTAEKP